MPFIHCRMVTGSVYAQRVRIARWPVCLPVTSRSADETTQRIRVFLPTGVAQPSEVDVFSGVCLSVCPQDNFRTTKQDDKLGGWVHCTEISPEFEGQGQRPKVKVTRDKKRKTAESSPLTMRSIGRAPQPSRTQHASRINRRYHCVPPGADGLRRWENQRMLSSSLLLLKSY